MKTSVYCLAITILLLANNVVAFGQNGKAVANVMFYNVENLFDTVDDSLKLDNEFLPNGDRRWNNYRLYAKLTNISKVILNTGNWEPPAIIGMCEVENRDVVEKLVHLSPVKSWNYHIIHKDSPDERGIDVAAIYRPDIFQPISYNYFSPVPETDPVPETREILYVSGVVAGIDTVHIFFNHWPSRYGGLMETRSPRQLAARRLKNEVDKLQQSYVNPKIIIMGDFNDQPADQSILGDLQALPLPASSERSLVNLSYNWLAEGKGTLKFQSAWNVFDQVIVSRSLLDNRQKLFSVPEDAWIMNAPFLLEKDDRYTGMKLKRTYVGFKYFGGFSDHLPVILKLRRND